jgi:hypothetical protein
VVEAMNRYDRELEAVLTERQPVDARWKTYDR